MEDTGSRIPFWIRIKVSTFLEVEHRTPWWSLLDPLMVHVSQRPPLMILSNVICAEKSSLLHDSWTGISSVTRTSRDICVPSVAKDSMTLLTWRGILGLIQVSFRTWLSTFHSSVENERHSYSCLRNSRFTRERKWKWIIYSIYESQVTTRKRLTFPVHFGFYYRSTTLQMQSLWQVFYSTMFPRVSHPQSTWYCSRLCIQREEEQDLRLWRVWQHNCQPWRTLYASQDGASLFSCSR